MALPEQIRKQTEAVQALYQQQEAGPTAEVADEVRTEETADESAEAESVASGASEQRPAEEKSSEETLAHKYRTLQGMYNAEVPRLHHQNREMQQRISQLEQLLASLSAAPASQASQPVAPAASAQPLVTQQDVDDYGDSIDVMRRVSKEELNPLFQRIAQLEGMLQQMQANVVPQVQAVAQRQAKSAEQEFWSTLTSVVPQWREINDQQEFQQWLLAVDPLTGIARQTYLEDAQRQLDAVRVANFFRAWLELTGQASVAQTGGSAPAARSELEKQVVPGRTKSSGTPSSGKGRTYTPADIRQFFDDVRAGRYKGREQERDRMERDIFAAQRENRIQLTA